ncbi:hypothetical protein [Nocardia sp. AG03]|uniref:hypothetical protein n=1 Tax=Nocardia sp. AG03 TaxID=3025312 RepID=UPI002418198D|nr:hypothetical protein [Nocardia sp. AG03]
MTLDDQDWQTLTEAANCAGMTLPEYLTWNTKLLARQSRPGPDRGQGRPMPSRRRPPLTDVSEEQAWAETFTERLSHRADPYRES